MTNYSYVVTYGDHLQRALIWRHRTIKCSGWWVTRCKWGNSLVFWHFQAGRNYSLVTNVLVLQVNSTIKYVSENIWREKAESYSYYLRCLVLLLGVSLMTLALLLVSITVLINDPFGRAGSRPLDSSSTSCVKHPRATRLIACPPPDTLKACLEIKVSPQQPASHPCLQTAQLVEVPEASRCSLPLNPPGRNLHSHCKFPLTSALSATPHRNTTCHHCPVFGNV